MENFSKYLKIFRKSEVVFQKHCCEQENLRIRICPPQIDGANLTLDIKSLFNLGDVAKITESHVRERTPPDDKDDNLKARRLLKQEKSSNWSS